MECVWPNQGGMSVVERVRQEYSVILHLNTEYSMGLLVVRFGVEGTEGYIPPVRSIVIITL